MLSPQARHSLYAYDVVERRVKKGVGIPQVPPRKLEKIGIVGAGLMATQLATLFLKRVGVPLVIRDLDQSTVDQAVASIREELADRWCPLTGTTDVAEFAGCDLVLEAVFEEMTIKQQVFAELSTVVGPDCILATNTSSLSVAEMGADVGLHFFNPVAMMPLVELVRTDATSDETLATAWALTKQLRKRAVVVGDAPAFVVNRVLTRMTSVLMDALEHGNTVEDTDEAILRLGLPMAPSVLLQLVGPRVALHVLETLHDAYPERFPLSQTLANYAEGREEIALVDESPLSQDELLETALGALADEIHHLLDEGVVPTAADVDTALILGAGFPFWLGGITKHLEQLGISERMAS